MNVNKSTHQYEKASEHATMLGYRPGSKPWWNAVRSYMNGTSIQVTQNDDLFQPLDECRKNILRMAELINDNISSPSNNSRWIESMRSVIDLFERYNESLKLLKSMIPEENALFIDDVRPCPDGYKLARTFDEAKFLIEEYDWEVISFDHDLGETDIMNNGLTLMDILEMLVTQGKRKAPNHVLVHTDNGGVMTAMRQTAASIIKLGKIFNTNPI